MKSITATEAKQRFGELLENVRDGAITIQRNGRDVAILMTLEELKRRESGNVSEDDLRERVLASHERSMKKWGKVYEALAK